MLIINQLNESSAFKERSSCCHPFYSVSSSSCLSLDCYRSTLVINDIFNNDTITLVSAFHLIPAISKRCGVSKRNFPVKIHHATLVFNGISQRCWFARFEVKGSAESSMEKEKSVSMILFSLSVSLSLSLLATFRWTMINRNRVTFDRCVCTVVPVFGQDGSLYFSVSPGEHSVAEGSPVRLRCEAQPSSLVKYSWKIDGQPLAPSPRRHQDGGDLRITRVNRILDSGNFVCVATHEETEYSIESSPAKIDIQCE